MVLQAWWGSGMVPIMLHSTGSKVAHLWVFLTLGYKVGVSAISLECMGNNLECMPCAPLHAHLSPTTLFVTHVSFPKLAPVPKTPP